MEALSERYGWTPDEIRNIAYDDVQAYLEIISIKNKEQAWNAKSKNYGKQ